MPHAIICIDSDKRFAGKNSGVSCLTVSDLCIMMWFESWAMRLEWAIRNWKSSTQNWFKFARYYDLYTVFFGKSIQIYGLVVRCHWELGGICPNSAGPVQGTETLCSHIAILPWNLCGTAPVSGLTCALLYCWFSTCPGCPKLHHVLTSAHNQACKVLAASLANIWQLLSPFPWNSAQSGWY